MIQWREDWRMGAVDYDPSVHGTSDECYEEAWAVRYDDWHYNHGNKGSINQWVLNPDTQYWIPMENNCCDFSTFGASYLLSTRELETGCH